MNKKKLLYLGLLLILTVMISVSYFSYAFYIAKIEEHGKLNIVVGTLDYKLESKELKNNKITVAANSYKMIKASIKNINEIESKYKMYYQLITNLNDTEKNNVHVEYSYLSKDVAEGSINKNEIKELVLTIINDNNKQVELKIDIEGGFLHNDIELSKEKYGIEENKILVDYSGNKYHGTFMNGCKVTYDEQEKMYGISFDGVDDYVDVANLPETINWADGFVIEFEAKFDQLNYFSRIFDFGNGALQDNILVSNFYENNKIIFHTVNGNIDASHKVSSEIVDINQKNRYKIIYKKINEINNMIYYYKNGELIDSIVANDNTLRNILRTSNYLGKSNYGDPYFNGKIYNLKITEASGNIIIWYAPNLQFDYDYISDNNQEFNVPINGKYKIELWGAHGTNANSEHYGGNGGYVSGKINLEITDRLFVYVGGMNGYNGGGNYNDAINFSGGGATDIRLINGNFDDYNSLKSRIMVAAGGGAGGYLELNDGNWIYSGIGGNAGGLEGYNGISGNFNTCGTHYIVGGGNQTGVNTTTGGNIEGTFGTGGSYSTDDGSLFSGGGGGYYGGTLMNCGYGGGGGSSFISGHTGCVAVLNQLPITSKSNCETGTTNRECSIHYSGYYFDDTSIIDGAGYSWTNTKGSLVQMPKQDGKNKMIGNPGNGYAKITYIVE